MISTKEQTLDEFMASGEGTRSFEEWYRFHNLKDPIKHPLTMFGDEWYEELAIFALDRAGWPQAGERETEALRKVKEKLSAN